MAGLFSVMRLHAAKEFGQLVMLFAVEINAEKFVRCQVRSLMNAIDLPSGAHAGFRFLPPWPRIISTVPDCRSSKLIYYFPNFSSRDVGVESRTIADERNLAAVG